MKTVNSRPECYSCLTYHKNKDLINCIEQPKGTNFRLYSNHVQIIIITEGCCTVQLPGFNPVAMEKEQILAIPHSINVIIKPKELLRLTVFNLALEINYFEPFSDEIIKTVMEQRKAEQKDLYPVMASECIKRYLAYLAYAQENEFACVYYLKLKQMEFFHLLSSDYSEKELAKLLAPVLSINIIFAIKVIENYRLFGTIDNLVETMNYSQADFKKQFTRIFGKSPYRWMYQKKTEQVYHSLIGNRKTFTQLATDLGFSSPSHFNNFCQQAFNASPGEVRKGKRVRI